MIEGRQVRSKPAVHEYDEVTVLGQPVRLEISACEFLALDRLGIAKCRASERAEVREFPGLYLERRKPVLAEALHGRLSHAVKPSRTLAEMLKSGEWLEIGRSLCGPDIHDLHPRSPFMLQPPSRSRRSPWL